MLPPPARWEFAVRHLLCASDVEGYPMGELLALADDETRALWSDLRLGYTEAAGHPLLRAEIAALYEGLTPDDTLVFVSHDREFLDRDLALVYRPLLAARLVELLEARRIAFVDVPDAEFPTMGVNVLAQGADRVDMVNNAANQCSGLQSLSP